MNKSKQIEKTFRFSVACFSVMSLSILFMPMASLLSKTAVIFVGCVFWLGLTTGFVTLFSVNKARKEYMKKMGNANFFKGKKSLKNLFFTTFLSKIFGSVAIIGFLTLSVMLFTNLRFEYVSIVTLFLVAFSLCMYCIFNGKNYKYIKQLREGK